jgi:hypothetical protein
VSFISACAHSILHTNQLVYVEPLEMETLVSPFCLYSCTAPSDHFVYDTSMRVGMHLPDNLRVVKPNEFKQNRFLARPFFASEHGVFTDSRAEFKEAFALFDKGSRISPRRVWFLT